MASGRISKFGADPALASKGIDQRIIDDLVGHSTDVRKKGDADEYHSVKA